MNYKPHGKLLDGIPSITPPHMDEDLWTVDTTVRYVTRDGWLVTLYKGEESDLASIPRILRALFGANGKETVAALFHDHVFGHRKERLHATMKPVTHCLTWRECNIIMHDIMILCGTGWIRRNAIMSGLWAFSYPVYLFYKIKQT